MNTNTPKASVMATRVHFTGTPEMSARDYQSFVCVEVDGLTMFFDNYQHARTVMLRALDELAVMRTAQAGADAA